MKTRKAVLAWAIGQPDQPALPEAIRRLIDTALDRGAPDLQDFPGLPIAITQEFCSLGTSSAR